MKNNDTKKVEDYKRRIQNHAKNNNDDYNFKFFKTAKVGIIVNSYPESFEQNVYESFAELLTNKYPTLCDKKSIVDTLSSYGKIYTAKLFSRKGIYHTGSGNILVYSFLNKLNDTIVHELLHKLGFLQFDESFYNMPSIFQETGAEIVTNTILEKPVCQENILGNMWGRCVGVQPAYLLESILVSQFNQACGSQALERTTIAGKNFIEPELISLLGRENYAYFLEQAKELCLLENRYWQKQSEHIEQEFCDKMATFQDNFLECAFDSKFGKVKTESDAKRYLTELMAFSDFRVKRVQGKPKDDFFDEYFMEKKKELSKRFGIEIEVEDIRKTWNDRFPIIMLDTSQEAAELAEKRKIDELANERTKSKATIFRLPKKKSAIPVLAEDNNIFKVDDVKPQVDNKTNRGINKKNSDYER